MRALPAVSLEYFGSTALGKTAGPAGAAGAAASLAVSLASFLDAFLAASFGAALGFPEVVPLLAAERAGGFRSLVFGAAFLRGQGIRLRNHRKRSQTRH